MSTTANDAQWPRNRTSVPVTDPTAAAGPRHPLSAGQRRAWFLQTRDPEDTTLNISLAYRLTGALDVQRLRDAVGAVVTRHEILRTTYGCAVDGTPYQQARDDLALSWQEYDLTELPEPSRARRLEVLARRELGRPFELTSEAPLRITLVRTAAAESVFVLVVHTICWDDDSWGVFLAELNAAYNGADALAEPQPQYVAVALAGDQQGEPDPKAVDYWRRTLRPLPESLELPGRPPTVTAGSHQTGRIVLPVPHELVDQVYAFAGEYGATPFAVLLASYHAIIHRYTAATDFLVAVPVSTRDAGAVSVIGYFGNTVLMRAALHPSATFADYVLAVDASCADAFANQDVGIDRVVREVNPDRSDGRDGLEQLVRIGFGVREGARGFAFDEIAAAAIELGRPVSQVPLLLTVVLQGERVHVEAEYWEDELDRPLVEQLLTNFLRLLGTGMAAPDHRVGDVDIFDEHDRARMLTLSHGELVDTSPTTMVDLFEQRVAATPEALAVIAPHYGDGADLELTYSALNRRANRLAYWLIRQGVGSEDVVALRLATSVEFVVAVLGVLKAGAAYLPIDPANPDERIDEIDRDAGARWQFGRVELAIAEEAAMDAPDRNPVDGDRVRPLRPDNVAYVIYTSGSTGKPKGVPVSHAAIADHLAGFAAEWGMTSADRLLQSSPVSFDASLLDIFVTLTVGARLVIPKSGAFRDIPYVADLIAHYGVTVLHMVPSTLSTFLLLPEVSEWRALRHVPVGGEALLGEVADRFAGVFDAELRNHYGPTEAVVSATHMRVDGPQGPRIVPIGKPNRNVYAYLLDDRLQLVPTGVVGEIYLGGTQLARGYLNRVGLTAQRFIADPFLPGQRLYRTGDLARRNAADDIEFVGRADEQVKVRGYRIELGEVEAVLAGHPAVGHCVVIAAADRAIGIMLAAYLVPADGGELDIERVRAHAAAVLPEYMLPAAFTVIDEIPLTGHGKLDRHALPEPVRRTVRPYREPGTATESRLTERFGQVLGLDRVGADDSFFELGGHSLLANQLVMWIRDEFGVEVDVRMLFDTPTVVGLAALIEATPVAARSGPSAAERDRLLGEWASGVELPDVPGIPELIRRARCVPGSRIALRYGTRTLTYGELFEWIDRTPSVRTISASPALEGVVALLAACVDVEVPAEARPGLPGCAALAAAVADRRAVVADRRFENRDPALGSADVRLIVAPWGEAGIAIEALAGMADGATVVITTEPQVTVLELAELIATQAVTHVALTERVAADLVRTAEAMPTVRRWDVIGTAATPALAEQLSAISADSVATLAYGVPEYAGVVARGRLDGTGRTRPIPGARVLVLDEFRQPVSPGVLGDVYIGGVGLIATEIVTAAGPVIADPTVPDGCVLRTGDRAWWNTEGWLIFA